MAADLHGRIALVTGAGGGLGRAVALSLSAAGVRVILVGRSAERLDAVSAEITAQGGQAIPYAADVTDAEQVGGLRAWVSAHADHLDALVNCAGEAFIRPLDDTTSDDWARILAVNLTAPYLTARAFLPLLRQSANASIINIASKVALHGYANVTAYTAAKTGLLGFGRSLAAELRADEIRVITLCPGPMDTPMRWAATPDFERKTVIDPALLADHIRALIMLPRGVTASEYVLQSMHYD